MKLRILSVLLVCLLVFGLVPGAMATEPAETVQPSDPTELVDTQPQETEPAETTEPSELDDNELPPMVVG